MLLDNSQNYIQIKLDYIQKKNNNQLNKIIIVYDINQLNQNQKKQVKTLITKWKILNYKQTSKLKKKCRLKGWDQPTLISIDVEGKQKHRNIFDYVKYNDLLLKNCLFEWDLLDDNGDKIECNIQNINLLPKNVIYYFLNKYQQQFQVQDQQSGYLIKYMRQILQGNKGMSNNTPVKIKQAFVMSQLNQSLQSIKLMNDYQFNLYSILAFQMYNDKKLTIIKSGKV